MAHIRSGHHYRDNCFFGDSQYKRYLRYCNGRDCYGSVFEHSCCCHTSHSCGGFGGGFFGNLWPSLGFSFGMGLGNMFTGLLGGLFGGFGNFGFGGLGGGFYPNYNSGLGGLNPSFNIGSNNSSSNNGSKKDIDNEKIAEFIEERNVLEKKLKAGTLTLDQATEFNDRVKEAKENTDDINQEHDKKSYDELLIDTTGLEKDTPAGAGANPTAGTDANPTAGTGANPTAGTGANPPAGTGTNPPAGTGTNPTAGTGANPPAVGVDTQDQNDNTTDEIYTNWDKFKECSDINKLKDITQTQAIDLLDDAGITKDGDCYVINFNFDSDEEKAKLILLCKAGVKVKFAYNEKVQQNWIHGTIDQVEIDTNGNVKSFDINNSSLRDQGEFGLRYTFEITNNSATATAKKIEYVNDNDNTKDKTLYIKDTQEGYSFSENSWSREGDSNVSANRNIGYDELEEGETWGSYNHETNSTIIKREQTSTTS